MGWKLKRVKQCAKCPWRKDVNPHEIPNGYSAEKHAALASTIARPGGLSGLFSQELRIMACHETHDAHCVGWLVHQMGPGNNIMLRLRLLDCENLDKVRTVGPQWEGFEQTLPRYGEARQPIALHRRAEAWQGSAWRRAMGCIAQQGIGIALRGKARAERSDAMHGEATDRSAKALPQQSKSTARLGLAASSEGRAKRGSAWLRQRIAWKSCAPRWQSAAEHCQGRARHRAARRWQGEASLRAAKQWQSVAQHGSGWARRSKAQ